MRDLKIAGYPVVDADEPLVLEIKKMDVTRGEPQEPAHCAIARACKRSLDIVEVRVHVSRTYLRTSDGEWLRYMTPPSIRTEMIAYDHGGTFEPGEYRFPIACPALRLGASKPTGPKKTKGKKRIKHHRMSNIRAWSTE